MGNSTIRLELHGLEDLNRLRVEASTQAQKTAELFNDLASAAAQLRLEGTLKPQMSAAENQNVSSTNAIQVVSGQRSAEELYGKRQIEAIAYQETSDSTSAFEKAFLEAGKPEAQVYVLWAGFTLEEEHQEFLRAIEYYRLRVKLTDTTWLIRTTDTADKICKHIQFYVCHWHNILVASVNLDTLAISGPRSMGEIRKALGLEDGA